MITDLRKKHKNIYENLAMAIGMDIRHLGIECHCDNLNGMRSWFGLYVISVGGGSRWLAGSLLLRHMVRDGH